MGCGNEEQSSVMLKNTEEQRVTLRCVVIRCGIVRKVQHLSELTNYGV